MVLETHMKSCVTEPDFLETIFLPPKLENWTKNGAKTGFFKLLKNLVIIFTEFYNENLYYLLCSCTNPVFGKIFVPEIWVKMFLASQLAGFFNQPYLQNKSTK